MQFGARILWVLTAGFLVGVFVRSLVAVPIVLPLFLCLLAVVWIVTDKRRGTIVCAFLISCALGIVRMDAGVLDTDKVLDARISQTVAFDGIVADEPDERETSVRVPVRAMSLASSTRSLHATVLVILPAHTQIFYGEKVHVSGTLQLPKAFDAGTGRSFNYPGYLAAQGIVYELDRARLNAGDGFSGNPIVAGAYDIKHLFVRGLERALPEPQSGLAGGITVGDKRALGKELTQEFRIVSLVHIIVLSGYNITIVIKYLFDVLAYFRSPRYLRFGLGAFVALFFAVMTGFASASLRAALMALIAISGQLSGRIYKPERALAVVAAGMVMWNPYLLVFDPGFQLSFLATAGLMAFSPIFERVFDRVPEVFGLREIITTTSSAQLAVLPLLLYESGNLSLVSLPANLLSLAVIPPAMFLSALAAVAGILLPTIAPVIGFPAYILLSYVIDVAHVLANIPFASLTVPAFSAWFLVPVYGAFFACAIKNSAAPEKGAAEKTRRR